MKIAKKYSHLNGEEYLIVHHQKEYSQIMNVIKSVDASKYKTKVSKERGKKGTLLYSPSELNAAFAKGFKELEWNHSVKRRFYVSSKLEVVKHIEPLSEEEQKKYLSSIGHPLYKSFNETDFIKNQIGVEVQLGKYFAVTYDLFVKHLSFYTGEIINVGVEIIPTKILQQNMSSGPSYFEKEVHNVLRHGRTNPPVPLLILGIEP